MISILTCFLCIKLFCNHICLYKILCTYTFYVDLFLYNWDILYWIVMTLSISCGLWLVLLPVHGSVWIWNKSNTIQLMKTINQTLHVFMLLSCAWNIINIFINFKTERERSYDFKSSVFWDITPCSQLKVKS
jgi:hypothetical protein